MQTATEANRTKLEIKSAPDLIGMHFEYLGLDMAVVRWTPRFVTVETNAADGTRTAVVPCTIVATTETTNYATLTAQYVDRGGRLQEQTFTHKRAEQLISTLSARANARNVAREQFKEWNDRTGETVLFTDQDGNTHVLDSKSFYEALIDQRIRLFGAGMPELLQMRIEYDKRAGGHPITVESVKKALAR